LTVLIKVRISNHVDGKGILGDENLIVILCCGSRVEKRDTMTHNISFATKISDFSGEGHLGMKNKKLLMAEKRIAI